LRPDVSTGSRRTTNGPTRLTRRLKSTSSAAKNRSSKPPTASNAARVEKMKHPAPER
jgi:hypothetical protein